MDYGEFQRAMQAQAQGEQLRSMRDARAQRQYGMEQQREYDWKRDQNDKERMYGRQPFYHVPDYNYQHKVNPNRTENWQPGSTPRIPQYQYGVDPNKAAQLKQPQNELMNIINILKSGDEEALTKAVHDSTIARDIDGRAFIEWIGDEQGNTSPIMNYMQSNGNMVRLTVPDLEQHVNRMKDESGHRMMESITQKENPYRSVHGRDRQQAARINKAYVQNPDGLEPDVHSILIRPDGTQQLIDKDYINSIKGGNYQTGGQGSHLNATDVLMQGFGKQPDRVDKPKSNKTSYWSGHPIR